MSNPPSRLDNGTKKEAREAIVNILTQKENRGHKFTAYDVSCILWQRFGIAANSWHVANYMKDIVMIKRELDRQKSGGYYYWMD